MVTTDADRPSNQVRPTPQTWQGWLRVWALWLVLTTIGGLAGLGLAAYLESFAVVSGWLPWEIQTGIALTAAGAGMGLGQWLLLQPWVHKAWQWIVPTVAGQPLGWAAAVAVNWHYDAWVLTWVVSGLGQWFVLRRWVHRSWWWLIAAVSYAPLRWLTDRTGAEDVEVWGGVLVYGTPVALTGLILMLLFAHSARREQLKARTRPADHPLMQSKPTLLRYLTTPPRPIFLRYLWVLLMVVFGLVSSAALLVVLFVLLIGLLFSGACSDLESVAITSPDGRYVARYSVRSCGGALGSSFSRVTIRDTAGPHLGDPESGVVSDGFARDLRVRWTDTGSLVIEYDLPASVIVTEGVFLECDTWRDITITCKALTAIQEHKNPIKSVLSSMERGEITATIGTSGVFLALTEGEAQVLGNWWVGPDHTRSYNHYHTAYTLTSQDGRRVYRSPQFAPSSIRAGHSKIGRQVIFERFSPAEDKWQAVRVEVFDLNRHSERQQALLLALEAAAAGTDPTTKLRFGSGFAALGAGEALTLGRQWVGGNPRSRAAADGEVWLISGDGKREYRGPRRMPNADTNGATARMQATFIVNSPGQGIRREIRVEILRSSQAVPSAPSTKPLFIETFDSLGTGKLPQASPDPTLFQAATWEGNMRSD